MLDFLARMALKLKSLLQLRKAASFEKELRKKKLIAFQSTKLKVLY